MEDGAQPPPRPLEDPPSYETVRGCGTGSLRVDGTEDTPPAARHQNAPSDDAARLDEDDESMPMLASTTVKGCVGSRHGCFPCTRTATGALAAIGLQAGVMAGAISLMALEITYLHLTCCVASVVVILGLSALKLSVQLMEKLVFVWHGFQVFGTVCAAVCWALTVYSVGDSKAVGMVAEASLGVIALGAAQAHLYYFICVANGTGAHFKTALILIALGILVGSTFHIYILSNYVAVAIGIAAIAVTSAKDYGKVLRDTCHYRIGRYALIRTFSSLGRAWISSDMSTALDYSPRALRVLTPNFHEETFSRLALMRGMPVFILAPYLGLALCPVSWGICKLYAPETTGFQTGLGAVLSASAGHWLALLVSPVASLRSWVVIELVFVASFLPQVVGCALVFMQSQYGNVMFLGSSVSAALLSTVFTRKMVSDGRRLAASYFIRLMHTGAYASVALCAIVMYASN